MISVEECKNIAYEILSCHLEDLSVKERRKILGVSELIHWRADDQRSETNQAYYDYVKTVFEMTKNNFDWAAFVINFNFAATPILFIVGALIWRFWPYTKRSTVLLIAGIWRSHFWNTATTISSHTPYARKGN